MHCPSCSMLIQMEVGDLPGVRDVVSDHRTGMTEVTFDDETLSLDQVVSAVTRAGYPALPVED